MIKPLTQCYAVPHTAHTNSSAIVRQVNFQTIINCYVLSKYQQHNKVTTLYYNKTLQIKTSNYEHNKEDVISKLHLSSSDIVTLC